MAAGLGKAVRSGDVRVDGVLSKWVWGSLVLSYSDPDAWQDYGSAYRADFDRDGIATPRDGFGRLSATQLAATRTILEGGGARAGFAVEGFTNLDFRYAGGGSGAADIRIARTSEVPTAVAFLPGPLEGGDVWLGGSGKAPRAGNYDHLTLMHELGHALGLEHAHEAGAYGAVPAAWDTLEYTVMTYRSYVGAPTTSLRFEAWGAPQSYMMLDIAALQEMYGADYSVNAGNTVYTWTPGSGRTLVNGQVAIDPGGNRIFATVWDGGGRDTYDLSAYKTGVSVDLRPGQHSVFSAGQLADLGGGPNGGHARGNIFNALLFDGDARALIENAIGGAGHDRLVGNAAANRLEGGAGQDVIRGFGGADLLVGGAGADVFVFGAAGESSPAAMDRICPGAKVAAFQGPGAAAGDLIDLHLIDADTTLAGNQAFVFGGRGAGHLWLKEVGTVTYVCGNTDRDGAVEFQVAIQDGGVRPWHYTADDFLL